MPDSADRPLLARCFTYQLNTLSKLNDMATQALYQSASGLSLAEVRALSAVGSFQRLTVNQLALEVNLDKGQASRLAASLVDKGLLERRGAEDDKRIVWLTLSRAGRARWRQVVPLIEQRNEALLQGLSPTERATLDRLFERLLAQERAAQRGAGEG